MDVDSKRQLFFSILRLRRAVMQKRLLVASWWLDVSRTKEHYHVVIVLEEPMGEIERTAWECFLCSDRDRVVWDLMRISRLGAKTGILIREKAFQGFREPDAICNCKGKHDNFEVRSKCPALRKLQIGEPVSRWLPVNCDRKQRKTLPYFKFGKQSIGLLKILKER